MARSGAVADLVQSMLGRPVVATTSIPGGSICTATKVRLSDGSNVLVKTRPGAPPGFFGAEQRSLDLLRDRAGDDGPPVPTCLGGSPDAIVLAWVEHGRPSIDAAVDLGRRLAALHRCTLPRFGAEHDGFIGLLPLPNGSAATWPEFYATRRVLPYLKAAYDRGAVSDDDRAAVERLMAGLADVAGPAEPPTVIHGDLWSNNLVWGADDRVHLIDPAAHAGHRETDLAMLAMFGAPHLSTIIEAYDDAFALADGWRERVGLHQLHPLLVHAVLFGGGYGARAGAVARDVLNADRA